MRLRELLFWPWRLWLRAAEEAGEIVLRVAEAVAALPPLERGARWLRATARFGERVATPARGLALVALAAAVTLAASQFSDYRAVDIGATSYTPVESVAPAPDLEQRSPRSAHGLTVLAIAIAAFCMTALAVAGRWRLARLLIVLGAAVIAISLLVDAPEGLREGLAATTYEGAEATLLGGFWVQLASGVTLVVSGPLLAFHLRGGRRRARRSRPASRIEEPPLAERTLSASAGVLSRPRGSAPGSRSSGAEGAAT
jgi:hypothetical protein